MATVVYGIKKKVKVDKNLGVQQCPNCGHQIEMSLAHESGYVHIYYIPVFPLSGWKMKVCPICGVTEILSKNEFKAIKNS